MKMKNKTEMKAKVLLPCSPVSLSIFLSQVIQKFKQAKLLPCQGVPNKSII
jgi:hypothetical protein